MKATKAKKSNWQKIRKLFNDLHLWFGLISGIVVFVVCLTGTVYVYNTEIREAAAPQYYQVASAGKQKINTDSLLRISKDNIKGKVVGIKIPFDQERTVAILYNKPKKDIEGKESSAKDNGPSISVDKKAGEGEGKARVEKANDKLADSKKEEPKKEAGRKPRANQMMVNPYTGELIGDVGEIKNGTNDMMQVMFGLHRWLLLNEIKEPIFDGIENRKLGSWITGTATLLFLLGVISGMIIWFPNKLRGWKNGLSIKWSGNWKRINHDIHNTLGFYSCIILFLMSVTGPFWSFDWYRTGWQKTWGTYEAPSEKKEEKTKLVSIYPITGKRIITIDETLIAINKVLPYDGDVTINFPKDSTGTISVMKNKVGFFAPSAGDKLTLDQYTGEILEKEIFVEKTFSLRASASVKALHIGDVYGPFTKILYFISCLIATSLPVTGVFIWINKMKKKPKRK